MVQLNPTGNLTIFLALPALCPAGARVQLISAQPKPSMEQLCNLKADAMNELVQSIRFVDSNCLTIRSI
jgi:hypothetical protein